MDQLRIKETIQAMMKVNYPDFIITLISVETGIEDWDYLNEAYCNYI